MLRGPAGGVCVQKPPDLSPSAPPPPPPGLLLPWRWLAVAGEGPVLVMILLLSFMPSSPRFLLSRGRDSEALQALAWLRGANADIHREFQQIQDNVQRQVGGRGAVSSPPPAPPAVCGCGLPEPCLLFVGNRDTCVATSRCHSPTQSSGQQEPALAHYCPRSLASRRGPLAHALAWVVFGRGRKGVSAPLRAVQGGAGPAGGRGLLGGGPGPLSPLSPLSGGLCLQSSRMSWAEARDPHMYRPIAIAVLMRFLQQLTGITPVLVYLQPIFNSTAVLLVSAGAAPGGRGRAWGRCLGRAPVPGHSRCFTNAESPRKPA